MKKFGKVLLCLSIPVLMASTALSITSAVQCAGDNTDLQNTNAQLEEQLKDKDTALENANKEIDGYKEQIKDYEDQISDYENNQICVVNFYIDDLLYDSNPVVSGQTLQLVPTINLKNTYGGTFVVNNWKLKDGTIVDLSTHVFNDNEDLYADYTAKFAYAYYYQHFGGGAHLSGSNFATELVVPEEAPVGTSATSLFNNAEYLGLYCEADDTLYYIGDTIQFKFKDFNTLIKLTLFGKKTITATFKVDDVEYAVQQGTIYNIESAGNTKMFVDTTELVAPTKEGYTFKGWKREGYTSIENLDTYGFSKDVTFVAVFE